MNTRQILEAARDLIFDPSAWIQCQMGVQDQDSGEEYRFCLQGAVNKATYGQAYPDSMNHEAFKNDRIMAILLMKIITAITGQTFRFPPCPYGVITNYNDNADRTHSEVIAVLDKAIASCRPAVEVELKATLELEPVLEL